MKKLKITFLGLIYSLLIAFNSYSLENKILFKINNEIITTLDIFTEIKYLETINDEFRKLKKNQAFEVAKKSLIREKIKEIELKKNKKLFYDSRPHLGLDSYFKGAIINE